MRCVPPAARNCFTATAPSPSARRWKWLSKTATVGSPQQSGRLQFARDALDGVLDVLRLPRPSAHELPAPEQEHDHLGLLDSIDQAGELLRLVLHFLQAEGERDRVEVDLRAEVARGDDVLHVDDRVLLDLDAGGLDLLRDRVDGDAHMLEALRAGAHDLAAAEEQGGGLGLLQAVDEARELLRLVLRAAEGKGDGLQVQLMPERGRRHDVLDLDLGLVRPRARRRAGVRGGAFGLRLRHEELLLAKAKTES